VDGSITVRESHDIAHAVKQTIMRAKPAVYNVLVPSLLSLQSSAPGFFAAVFTFLLAVEYSTILLNNNKNARLSRAFLLSESS
jgi:hypothetical protein